MEPRIRFTRAADGVSIAFCAAGDGPPIVSLPPLVFSHCQMEWQMREWGDWYEHFAGYRRLVRYDGRGSGLSQRDVPGFSLEEMLLDIDAVADELGLERFALFGPNWGGLLGAAYAATRPQRVTRIVFWCSHISGASDQSRIRVLRPIAETDWELFANVFALTAFGWEAGALGRSFAEYIVESITPERFVELAEALSLYDVRTMLPDVRAPALVIQRRGSPSPDVSIARTLASSMPNARLALVEGRSPVPFVEDVDAVTAAMDEFLKEEAYEAASARGQALSDAALRTVLFTDLASSTALTERLGDTGAQELVRRHNTIVREALAASGGTEIKHTGDGIMASFPTASRAIECAIAIQRAVAARDEPDLQVHAGINAGEPVAEENDLFGTAVQLARRICDQAGPGQVLVSNVVRELAAGKGFLFAETGEVALRGFEHPVRLYEVRWRE